MDLVLAFDEQIEKLLRVDDGLAEIRHQADQRRVPFVDDLVKEVKTKSAMEGSMRINQHSLW